MKTFLGSVHIIVISLSLTFLSCNKTGLQKEYLLTDEMKDQNPFMGGEKLYYLSDSMEQVVFKVSARDNKVHEVPHGQRTNMWDLYEVERMYISSDEGYYFLWDMHYNAGYNFYIDFTYKNRGWSFTYDLPLSRENNNFVDSLFIQEQWYHNIFISEEDTIGNKAYRLYYSTDYGIIKVDFSDNSYLELEKIQW